MEGLLGEQKAWGSVRSVWRDPGGGLAADQLVVDIGAELVELNRGESQQLVARLVRLFGSLGIASIQEGPQGNVMLIEYGIVELGTGAPGTISPSVHIRALAGAADRGRR